MSEIPQFSLARQLPDLAPAIEAAVARVLASGRYAQGPECAAFEVEAAAALTAGDGAGDGEGLQALTCASGTDALQLALRAAGVGPGDRVLTTPFTFFATASAIVQTGARPEFVDIDPVSFNIDPDAVAAALERPGPPPAALMPVHLYGQVADMARLRPLAARYGVPIIEDAAQAFGAREGATPAGAAGLAGCFSFYPTKNLGAAGEGGMVTSANGAFLERVRLLRVHGSRRRYEHEILGWNARMHEIQAAVLRAKLPHLAAWNQRRRDLAAVYEEHLAGLDAFVRLPARPPGHIFHQYIIRARRRDALRAHLQQAGIGAEVYYPIPLHRQPALCAVLPDPLPPLPEAERAAADVLALPMFPELEDAEVARVTEAIRGFYTA